ncbi:hypothetical protein GCM10023191_087750 [Actinoallomurus oryzae]|uniref:Uncharacterized protein n=1 Tax=Actinoallomurus oryzae TaxID=502180 RepID=A0ABP8R2T0_9ACTN
MDEATEGRLGRPDGEYDYPDTVPDGDGGFIEKTLPGYGFTASGGTHVAALADRHFNGDESPLPRASGTLRGRSLWQRQLGDLLTRPLAGAGAADVTRLAHARVLLAHPDVRGVLALLRARIAYRLTRDSTGRQRTSSTPPANVLGHRAKV